MTFDFTYGKYLHRYDNTYIYKMQDSIDDLREIMRVPKWLVEVVEGEDREAAVFSLCTLLHGYVAGMASGKKAKIREFKNMFDIN